MERVAFCAILTHENKVLFEKYSDRKSNKLDMQMMLFSSIDQFYVFSKSPILKSLLLTTPYRKNG
jgi:hypothetical protein